MIHVSLYQKCLYRATISKLFSTNHAIVANIPSNLRLADASVLTPKPTIDMPKTEYYFSRTNIPATFPVVSFSKPENVVYPMKSSFSSSPTSSASYASLHPTIFGAAIRKDIILDIVRYHRLKSKQAYSSKRKSEIRGSNKKPHPQKGTGRAQAGHRRNAIWRGGHKAMGPVVRDFSIRLNRKMKAQGMMISLAAKLIEKNFIVVDEMRADTIKTKQVYNMLKAHNLHEKQCVLIDVEFQKEFELSAKNIPNIILLNQMEANVYEIVRKEKLIITKKALEMLQTRIMEQYLHQGKRRSYIRGLASYRDIVAKGKELGPQTGIPFQQAMN